MTIGNFKTNAVNQLKDVSPSPQLDAEVLLEFTLGYSKTQILMNRDQELTEEKSIWLESALQKRKTGLPIAYITGHKEFYGYDFLVSPAVLIPKPDTEILIERAIEIIIEKMDARPNSLLTICDMCTGSGCIGLSVLRVLLDEYKIPESQLPKVSMVDISEQALAIAEKNAEALKVPRSNLRFIRSNLFQVVPQKFDIILTNPPYIPSSMVDDLLKDGRSEPRLALDGDITIIGEKSNTDDGLEIIRNLIPQSKEHLSPLGTVLMETGEYNAEEASLIAQNYGFKTKIIKDLEGQLRLVEMNL